MELERAALRITGYAFYLLTIGLLLMAGYRLEAGCEPVARHNRLIIWFYILLMSVFSYAKNKMAKKLESAAILADIAADNFCVCMLADDSFG